MSSSSTAIPDETIPLGITSGPVRRSQRAAPNTGETSQLPTAQEIQNELRFRREENRLETEDFERHELEAAAYEEDELPVILPDGNNMFTAQQMREILLRYGIDPTARPPSNIPRTSTSTPISATNFHMAGQSSNSSTSLSSTSTRASVQAGSAVVKHQRIPENEFIRTSVAQSKANEDFKFSNNSKTNKEQLKKFKMLLEDCKLMSLATKDRKPVKSTPQNEFGYVDASCRICPITSEEIITLQHDCIFQRNDRQRLLPCYSMPSPRTYTT